MTTIVYSHSSRSLAVDGRVCCGGTIMTDNFKKARPMSYGLLVMAGALSDVDKATACYPNNSSDNINCGGFLIAKRQVFSISYIDGEMSKSVCEYNDNAGSGGELALAAIDFGCSAGEAVQYAISRDCNSGGDIYVYDLDGKETKFYTHKPLTLKRKQSGKSV